VKAAAIFGPLLRIKRFSYRIFLIEPRLGPELARHRETKFELFMGGEWRVQLGIHTFIFNAQTVKAARHKFVVMGITRIKVQTISPAAMFYIPIAQMDACATVVTCGGIFHPY